MSGATDTDNNSRTAHALSTITPNRVKKFTSYLYQYYFADNTFALHNDGFAIWGLYALALNFTLGFFTIGFGTVAAGFAVVGITLFLAGYVLHFTFWVAGHVYRDGLIRTVSKAIMFTGMLLAVVIIGAFLLYGWVIPGFIWVALVNSVPGTLGEIFLPFGILAFLALAAAWYAKGLKIIENA